MATLTPAQIAGYAKSAGFPDSEIATATAVALAESGGRTDAQNRNTNGSTDYGVWQINTVHGALLNNGDKFNPADNARMAFTVWSQAGRKWTPWSVYKSGAYRTQMPRAALAAAAPAAGPVAGAAASGGGSTGDVPVPVTGGPTAAQASTSSGILDLLSGLVSGGLWTRIGAFIFGGVLILFSLWKLTGAGDVIVNLAGGAVKKAALAA